jgi:hypothetical protein
VKYVVKQRNGFQLFCNVVSNNTAASSIKDSVMVRALLNFVIRKLLSYDISSAIS